MSERPIELVEWIDVFPIGDGWTPIDGVLEVPIRHQHAVGFVVEGDDVLALLTAVDGDAGTFFGGMVIPKAYIVKRTQLRAAEPEATPPRAGDVNAYLAEAAHPAFD